MIVGVGVDLVNVPRFAATLRAVSALRTLYFTESELLDDEGRMRSEVALATRYAAKQALLKSLGAPPGLALRDCEIRQEPDGRPWLATSGTIAEAANELQVQRWHVSMAQDGDMAIGYVVAEGEVSLEGVVSVHAGEAL